MIDKDDLKGIADQAIIIIGVILVIIFFAFAVYGAYRLICDNGAQETDAIIEQAEHKNDSIKIEVKRLDSLKNEEIITVKGLNNDSTLELFKRLVSE